MARDHAKLLIRAWGEPDWRARTLAEQHLYELLISQESLNLAGVLPLQPRKWASCTADVGEHDVRDALEMLRRARYVVVDEDTEEVLVRTFIRNDEGYKIPGVLKAALAAAEAAQSRVIRWTLAEELGRLPALAGKTAAEMTARVAATRHLLEQTGRPIREPFGEPIHGPSDNPSGMGSAGIPKEPIGGPSPEPMPEPPVSVSGSVSEVETVLEGGIVQEADARAPAVPDTPPAPLEDPDPETDERAYAEFVADARQRTQVVVSPIEGAMPPARCRNHLELTDPPPCGRCADARRAQEAWIADRDAKVAAARATVQAEMAEARRLEREAITACPRCDDRGINAHGTVCGHTTADEKIGPGRAAAKQALAEHSTRMAAKRRPDDRAPRRATSEQLAKIAILFGDAERDDRLAELSRILGREITTMTQLTRVEASLVIDHFEGPPSEDKPPADEEAVAEYREAVALNAAMGEPDPEPDVDPDDGTEPEPEGDDAFEDEYRRDQDTWATDDDQPAAVYSYAGGTDEPPF